MQLSAADRRSVIEDILDIQVFSNMNIVLRDKTSLVKGEITDINKALQINKERATGVITLIESLQRKTLNRSKRSKRTSGSTKRSKRNTQRRSSDSDAEIEKHLASITDEKDVESKIKKYEKAKQKIEREMSSLQKNLSFFEDHDNCPVCHSEITEDKREQEVSKASGMVSKLEEAVAELEKLEDKVVDRSNVIAGAAPACVNCRMIVSVQTPHARMRSRLARN